ncbi:FtsX-like permease family protein [Paenibacillus odorifer]|uniref:FtsX-like permease family protein n=1 Tax=Paenibacillus odorifer TaxID=189426 RepID=UPI001E418AA2|nr:FtsX-like permease family protein [Paenibacillus odorifer]
MLLLIIMLTSFMYFFVQFSIDRNVMNLDDYLTTQKQEDFRFQLKDSADIKQALKGLETQLVTEERSIKKVKEENKTYFLLNESRRLNLPYIVEGRLPEQANEIAVLPQFLQQNKLLVGDSWVIGATSFTISGSMYLPDYLTFVPFGEVQQNYAGTTFVLVLPEAYDSLKGQESQYYAATLREDKNVVTTESLRADSTFSYVASASEIDSDTELQKALESNKGLAQSFLIVLGLISLFIFYMFFKRFMALHKQDFGCFMALGFTRRQIAFVMAKFTLGIAITGCLLGMGLGYLGSNVLMGMLESTYSFPYFERGIYFGSVVNGILIPVGGALLITLCAVFPFMKQETHDLLNISISAQPRPIKGVLRAANRVVNRLPEKYRLSFRVALRKWNNLILSACAILLTTLLFILSYSLYQSSGAVVDTQMSGIEYTYDITYPQSQNDIENTRSSRMYYLQQPVQLAQKNGGVISAQMLGLDSSGSLFTLLDTHHNRLEIDNLRGVIVSRSFSWLYGIEKGDSLNLILNRQTVKVMVQAISQNGDANTIYTSKANLAGWMNTDSSLHTGEFSNEINTSTNVKVVTTADKRAALESSAVSNRSSAVINQIIGIVMGFLLIYLILLLNFQDSTRDMRILRLLGYKSAEISRLLIDVYRPLLVLLYIITLPVAVFITEQILRILSLQTGDYMPLNLNIWLLIFPLALILLQYMLVMRIFKRKLRRESRDDNLSGLL